MVTGFFAVMGMMAHVKSVIRHKPASRSWGTPKYLPVPSSLQINPGQKTMNHNHPQPIHNPKMWVVGRWFSHLTQVKLRSWMAIRWCPIQWGETQVWDPCDREYQDKLETENGRTIFTHNFGFQQVRYTSSGFQSGPLSIQRLGGS